MKVVVQANLMKDSQLVEPDCKERHLYSVGKMCHQQVKPDTPTAWNKEECKSEPDNELESFLRGISLSAPLR